MQTMQTLTATPVLATADTSLVTLDAHALDLGIEELDPMVAPWDWGDFGEGFKTGLTIAGLGAAGAGIAAT